MATNNNGLIYYKLDANVNGFPGDITKNCGLRGEEIDGNFNFLRGYDIKSISFDTFGTMYLTRYNGEVLTAKQADTPEYDFNYNPESGSLTIVTPDGKEIVLSGFKVTTNVYHDYSLDGYGSQELPLEVSSLAKTGRYLPAIKLIDTTLEDEEGNRLEMLPTEKNAKHDRYVTREKISRFGRLFPLSGVEKISKRLEAISSEWRVPTKADWDEILNVIDCAKPNHDKTESNIDLGEFAGSALKSTKYWNEDNAGILLSEDKFGFSIYPVGYCGNRGKDYYGSFGLSAGFWTSTVEDNEKDMFVKLFEHDSELVGQRTWGENYYLSLRLVKTFTGNNFNDAEDIDGFTSNCIHIPGTSTIWTKENIAFSQEQYDAFYPKKWKEFEDVDVDDNSYVIRYFINDWNGNGWDKHEIKEGEGIVLYEGENGRMHEWLLVDGELIDSAVLIKTEFQEEINHIHNRIDTEIADREEVDRQIWNELVNESKTREKIDNELWAAIEDESKLRTEVDNQLWEAVANEGKTREEIDNQLWATINQETVTREENDNKIWKALNDEVNRAQKVESDIWAGLENEGKIREDEDIKLYEAVKNETNRAQQVESELNDAIIKEAYFREESDKEIYKALENEATIRQEIDNQIWTALNQEIANREESDRQLQENIDTEAATRKEADDLLQQHIDENKVIPENNSVVIVPGSTDEYKNTVNTTIKVNLDSECEHLKLGENGIYFDGYFGQF